MQAIISKKPVSLAMGLRPDLYASDAAFLAAESQHVARAILAKTEPIPDGYRMAERKLRGELSWASDEAKALLFESLSAFISAEDPAAYLESLQ